MHVTLSRLSKQIPNHVEMMGNHKYNHVIILII